MRNIFARWGFLTFLALLIIFSFIADSVTVPGTTWGQQKISLPAHPLPTPLPWVKSPEGPGEFLLAKSPFSNNGISTVLHNRNFYATMSGLLMTDEKGDLKIIPATFGKPCMVVGELQGELWIQQNDGTLLGLNPTTYILQEKTGKLAGACITIDATSIWCYDSMELAHDALRERTMNREPFASAIIEYDRNGVEKRRFITDGIMLPKVEIKHAIIESDVVWIFAKPCLGIICGCGAKSYGESHLFRLDRVTGKVALIKEAKDISPSAINQSGKFIWTGPAKNDESTGKTCPVYQFDKKSFVVTPPIQIPQKYAGGLHAVRDGKLWCKIYPHRSYQLKDGELNQPDFAVFALTDGHRIHVDEAGEVPAELVTKKEAELISFRTIGAQPERVWISSTGNNLYDIPDTGEPKIRNNKELKDIGRFSTRNNGPSNVLFAYYNTRDDRNALIMYPGKDYFIKIYTNDFIAITSSEQRVWFLNDNNLVTCTDNLKKQTISLANKRGVNLIGNTTVAIDDKLYFFDNNQPYIADATKGTTTAIASWKLQVPDELKTHEEPGAAFLAPDGKIVFNLRSPRRNEDSKPEEHPVATLAAYNPKIDTWTFTPSDCIPYWGDTLNTSYGAFHVKYNDNIIYRGTATAWVKAGQLPFNMPDFRFGASTKEYLYLDTPIGIYRVRWSELLTDSKVTK